MSTTHSKIRTGICLFLAAAAILIAPGAAQAQLLITPLQVVMENRERSTEVILVNTTAQTMTYRITWEQYSQLPGGGYNPMEVEPGDMSLQNFAVFSPRQVTLAPNEKQTVRIAVRRPADLADGEYKSHMKFSVVPGPRNEQAPESGVSLGVYVNINFSIPVVYRAGDYDIQVELGTPEFDINENSGVLRVHVPVERSGIHGAIGRVEIYHTPAGGGESEMIGELENANLFPEINARTLKVPTTVDGIDPGTLNVKYYDYHGSPQPTKNLLAERSYPVRN